jgi:hypothetical protein
VEEAALAVQAGYANRMMLEISPENSFGVLSPAFRGGEISFALEKYSQNGCTFLQDGLCELHGSGYQPLECRHCHHTRLGSGRKCHNAIARDWDSPQGRSLVVQWSKLTGFWSRHITHT